MIFYHYDAIMLLRHSLISAFMGYYSVAFSELRNAMESITRGVIFNLLAIPKYRRDAEELRRINSFRDAESFTELLEVLEKRLGDRRPSVSIEIFDIISEEIENFNPEAAFTRLLVQLKKWDIITGEDLQGINEYYAELSRHTHRVHPRFSEVGSRVAAGRDWLDLEPVPEELSIYLRYFVDLNGWFTYLIMRVFNIDLVKEEYKKCIDWNTLKEPINKTSKLAKNYKSWRKCTN